MAATAAGGGGELGGVEGLASGRPSPRREAAPAAAASGGSGSDRHAEGGGAGGEGLRDIFRGSERVFAYRLAAELRGQLYYSFMRLPVSYHRYVDISEDMLTTIQKVLAEAMNFDDFPGYNVCFPLDYSVKLSEAGVIGPIPLFRAHQVQKLKEIWNLLKTVRLPRVGSNIPEKLTPAAEKFFIGLFSGGIAQYTVSKVQEILKLLGSITWIVGKVQGILNWLWYIEWSKFGMWFLAFCGAARLTYCSLNEHAPVPISEPVIGRILLVVTHDLFAHSSSRTYLMKLSENNLFQVIIPLCVIDRIKVEMQAGRRESYKANAAWSMLKDLLKSGRIRMQTACEESGLMLTELLKNGRIRLLDACKELGSELTRNGLETYEGRIVNAAYNFSMFYPLANVIILTHSDAVKRNARNRNLRTCTPALISGWRGG